MRGGVAQTLTGAVGGGLSRGASWVGEGTIVFAPYSSVLQRVGRGRRAPAPDSFRDRRNPPHVASALPGGKAVLFTGFSDSPTAIAVQPIGTGERRNLITGNQAICPAMRPPDT